MEIVIGTLPKEPMIRLLAMPLPKLLALFGLELGLLELMYIFRMRAPFRMSFVVKGQIMRPSIYQFIEDIVAVDGNGRTAYQMRLSEKYEASPYFRRMLHRLSIFWALSASLVSEGITYIVYSVNRDNVYIVGLLHLF